MAIAAMVALASRNNVVEAGPPGVSLRAELSQATIQDVCLLRPVERGEQVSSTDSTAFKGLVVLRRMRVSVSQGSELLTLIKDPKTYDCDANCATCLTCLPAIDRHLGIRLQGPRREILVTFRLGTQESRVVTQDQAVAGGRFGPNGEALRRWIARAFPGDPGLDILNVYGPPPAPNMPPLAGDTTGVTRVRVDHWPAIVERVDPPMPDMSRSAAIEGVVIVDALVGTDGRVRQTRIRKSIPMLDVASAITVKKWSFVPAQHRGRPVAVWVRIPLCYKFD